MAASIAVTPLGENVGSILNFSTVAHAATSASDFTYMELDDGTIEISKYVGDDEVVVIPSTIDGQTVTSIGKTAFRKCSVISVTIPHTVTTIGSEAFAYTKIKSLVIPSKVTEIGSSAFRGNEVLESISLPDSVKSLGAYSFSGCTALRSVRLPKGLTEISDHLFYNATALESITLPENVTSIGYWAFRNCTSLEKIVIQNKVSEITDYDFAGDTELANVYYTGSKSDWNNITVSSKGNTPLTSAKITYNYKVTDEDYPVYEESSSNSDSSSKADSSSKSESSSKADSSSKSSSSSKTDSSSKGSSSSADSSSSKASSSSTAANSSAADNGDTTQTVLFTGSESLGILTVSVNFSEWKTLAVKLTLSSGSGYAGLQIAGYDATHNYNSIQGWTEVTNKSSYERVLTSAELSQFSGIKTLEIQGSGATVTKIELIGTKKSASDSKDDTSSVADSSSKSDSSSNSESSKNDYSSKSDSSSKNDSSLSEGVTGDELGEVDFNNGKGLPWHICESMTGKMKFDISGGTYNITIVNPGGRSNGGEDRWDCQFRHRGLTLEEGHTYRITYSVKTSKSGYMYAKIGNMVNDDEELWHGNGLVLDMPTLSNDATQEEVEAALLNAKSTGTDVKYYQGWNTWSTNKLPANKWITVAYEFKYYENSNDGVSSDHWAGTVEGTAEYTFHLGGDGQYTPSGCFPAGTELQFDNMALIDLTDDKTNYPIVEEYQRNKILVNQVGYIAGLNKKATLVVDEGDDTPKTFKIVSTKTGKTVYTGKTTPKGADADSGDYVQIIDFSKFNTVASVSGAANTNTGAYYIECDGAKSYCFNIGAASSTASNSLYNGMFRDAMNYFYQNRSGIDIEAQYITSGDKDKLAHEGAHNPDEAYIQTDWINAYASDGSNIQKENGTLDVTGGWYDAGDHGKYVVNGGVSVWTLQNMYERAKFVTNDTSKYDDGALSIPESGNGYPDLLDEARYELEFMLKMQREDGMAYHKIHDYKWTGLAVAPADDDLTRIIKPVSTCATLNLAASAAQAYRLWKGIDDTFANECLTAAKKAYSAAKANPELFAPIDQAIGGGPYGDNYAEDDFYWAACELYAATGDSQYYTDLKAYKNTNSGAPADDKAFSVTTSLVGGENGGSTTSFTWGSTAALGTLTLSMFQDKLTSSEAAQVRSSITKAADRYIEIEENQGYGLPYLPTSFTDETNAPGEVFTGYEWGSNSMVVNNAMIIAYAADLNKDNADKYANGVASAMDYIFGRNAGEYSYVTGYGDHATQYVHHRYWSGLIDSKFPFAPSGVLSGGPNSGMQDPWIRGAGYKPGELAPQLCYLDHVEAWSTNECTINWNAPFAWVVSYLEDYQPSTEVDPDHVDGEVKLVKNTFTLDGMIGANFDYSIPEGYVTGNYDIKVTATSDDKTITVDFDENKTVVQDGEDAFRFTIPVASCDMTENYNVKLTVTDSKGNVIAETASETMKVNSYLASYRTGLNIKLRSFAAALQTYGYYSQEVFNQSASKPVTKPNDVSDVTSAKLRNYKMTTKSVDTAKKISIGKPTLMHEAETTIRFYASDVESVDVDKLYMVYNVDGKTVKAKVSYSDEEGYYADIPNIGASKLSNMYTVHFEENGSQVSDDVTYGAYSFVFASLSGRDENSKNLAKALYKYSLAAEAYIG